MHRHWMPHHHPVRLWKPCSRRRERYRPDPTHSLAKCAYHIRMLQSTQLTLKHLSPKNSHNSHHPPVRQDIRPTKPLHQLRKQPNCSQQPAHRRQCLRVIPTHLKSLLRPPAHHPDHCNQRQCLQARQKHIPHARLHQQNNRLIPLQQILRQHRRRTIRIQTNHRIWRFRQRHILPTLLRSVPFRFAQPITSGRSVTTSGKLR